MSEPRTEAGRRLHRRIHHEPDQCDSLTDILAIEAEAVQPSPDTGLNAAWAEAEAALPEGWVIWGHSRATKDDAPERDEVMVWAGSWRPSASMQVRGVGHNLPAALRALAVRLSESGS